MSSWTSTRTSIRSRRPSPGHCTNSARICVVGDDDQTIYQWRGSDVANILTFDRHYPEVEQISLEENFRSSEGVVETARTFIEQNSARLAKAMKQRADPRGARLWQVAARRAGRGARGRDARRRGGRDRGAEAGRNAPARALCVPGARAAIRGTAERVLRDYLSDNAALFDTIEFSEKQIEVSLGDGASLVGRIDLVRQIDTGETTIVDLKSSDRAQAEDVTEAQLYSEPFPVRGYKRIAVKIVDVYGNESVVVREI